ncbi:MAG: hypothetical protein R8K48_03845 [Gallionella sp.]
MGRLIRQAIYFIMITLVINAGGWTFNKEAVADVWFDDQRSLVVDEPHFSSERSRIKAELSPKIPCNHWCHAILHCMGLISQSTTVMLEFVNDYAIRPSYTVHVTSSDGLFRPPRRLS